MRFQDLYYPESRFGGFTDIDGTIAFYGRLQALASPESVVLDVGCGRGGSTGDPVAFRRDVRTFKGRVARVVGIDVDPAGATNPYLDEFHLIEGRRWPVEDEAFDICFADYVLEHVDDPAAFFSEVRRVVKPGGVVALRTTNAWGYVGVLARLIANVHHARVLSRVQHRRAELDVFPTRYRCNSVGKIRSMLARHGFEHAVYGYEAEPSYAEFSRLAYALAAFHQRYAPGVLKLSIFAFGRKLP